MMATRINSMMSVGWSLEEATWRMKSIEAAERQNKSIAECSGLVDGDHVMVEYSGSASHEKTPHEARVSNGMITVGGCLPSPGMVGRVLSKPFRLTGGDRNLSAVLADGTVLTQHMKKGCSVWRDAAGNDVNFYERVLSLPAAQLGAE